MANDSRLSFTKQDKLLKTDEFSSVFDFKRSYAGKTLVLSCKPNALQHARIGIVVGKKKFPRAVDRNQIKRRLREIFRTHRQRFPAYDLVVRLKNQPLDLSFSGLAQELTHLMARIR